MIVLFGSFAYHVGLWLYKIIVYIVAPFNPKAKSLYLGHKGLMESIVEQMATDERKSIWFHCASLGEFEQIRPILERLHEQLPHYKIVVTFFSPSGYEIRKNYPKADAVFYLPFDSAMNAKALIDAIRPAMVFFAKYELWYHYLTELKNRNIPVYLVSANFRPNQIYFKWYGVFFRNILYQFSHIFSQYEPSTNLLRELGMENVSTSGDTRFDNVYEMALSNFPILEIEQFKSKKMLFVLGSSYSYEEKLVASSKDYLTDFKIVVAPHQVTEQRIAEVEKTFAHFHYTRLSNWPKREDVNYQVLIVDTVGILANLYQYADLSFVGGGFNLKGGVHNILEPLAHGSPVLIGPKNHAGFPEVALSIGLGISYEITNTNQLKEALTLLLQSGKLLELKSKSKTFIEMHKGAIQIVLKNIRF